MKKLLTLACMLACIFGLTACGSEETLTEREQTKVELAQTMATQYMIPILYAYKDQNLDGYTAEEVEYQVGNVDGIYVDGYAFVSAVDSFRSAIDSIGNIQSIGTTTAKIDGNQIVVEVNIVGEKKEAVAEVVLSNDMFFKLESASLNPASGMGELMIGAALNTLIGMGTVFIVLILISAIISCFRIIPALQKKAAGKKEAKSTATQSSGVDNAVTQIAAQEAVSGDDLELAAVIAAAVAAYEGSASTDGYVVRSIRRRW